MLIKTKTSDFADLQDAITFVPAYDVPEVISLPITQSSASYLDWIAGSTRACR